MRSPLARGSRGSPTWRSRRYPESCRGILFVERKFGILEVHADKGADVEAAGRAVLDELPADPHGQLRPQIMSVDVIADISDLHAVIMNRNRQASMVLPGQTLLVVEMAPALYAAAAADVAEQAAPENTLVDVQMIGPAGRAYISGTTASVERARDAILDHFNAKGTG